MLGTQKDYWVASGVLEAPEEFNLDRNVERRGTGVNQVVFWVTDNLLSDWIQLPDCKPEHVVASR